MVDGPCAHAGALAEAQLSLERSRTAAVDAAAMARALADSLGQRLRDTVACLATSDEKCRDLDASLKAKQHELEGANAQIKASRRA
jgi:hypothetical protein